MSNYDGIEFTTECVQEPEPENEARRPIAREIA
jgi:hypothetical protein